MTSSASVFCVHSCQSADTVVKVICQVHCTLGQIEWILIILYQLLTSSTRSLISSLLSGPEVSCLTPLDSLIGSSFHLLVSPSTQQQSVKRQMIKTKLRKFRERNPDVWSRHGALANGKGGQADLDPFTAVCLFSRSSSWFQVTEVTPPYFPALSAWR